MSNFIILGDIHLGKNTNLGKHLPAYGINSRILDQDQLLEWVLEQAIDKNCSHLFLTGDIWEEPKPSPRLIAMFIAWLKKCTLHDIEVHIIMGNHDLLRIEDQYFSPLDIIIEADIDKVFIYKDLESVIIPNDNIAISLLPFRDRKSLKCDSNEEAIQKIHSLIDYEFMSLNQDYIKILIGHLALEGSIFIGDEVSDESNELFLLLDRIQYDYTWMGHVHQPQIRKKKPHIAHVGSMDASNFAQNEQYKEIIFFDTQQKTWQAIPLPIRKYQEFKLEINSEDDPYEQISSQLKEVKNKNIRIHLTHQVEGKLSREKLEKVILENGAHQVLQIFQHRPTEEVKVKSETQHTLQHMNLEKSSDWYIENELNFLSDKDKQQLKEMSLDIIAQFNETK